MLIAHGPLDVAWAFQRCDRFLPGRNYAKLSQNSSSWVPQSYEFVFQMEKAGTGGVLSGQAKLLGYGGFKMVYEVPEFDIVLKTCKPTPQGELWRTEYELFRSEGFQATWSAHYYGEFESETRKVSICQRACVTGATQFSALTQSGQWERGFGFLIDCVEIIFEVLANGFHPWDMKLDNWGVLQSQRVVAIDFDVWLQGAFSAKTMRLCLEKLLQDAENKAANTWMGEFLRQSALPYLESLKDQNNQHLHLALLVRFVVNLHGFVFLFSCSFETNVSFASHVLRHCGCITSFTRVGIRGSWRTTGPNFWRS